MQNRVQGILSRRWTSLSEMRWKFLNHKQPVHMIFGVRWFSGSGRLQLRLRIPLLQNSRLSLVRFVYSGWVIVRTDRSICQVLRWFLQIVEPIFSILGPFRRFSASYRMGQGARTVLGRSFYSSLKIPNNIAKPFSETLEIWFFQGSSVHFVSGVWRLVVSVATKWHLCIVSLRPFSWMHLNVALKLAMRWSASLAAMQISSTYWAHWSALRTLSRYSLKKLENADSDRLRLCVKRL